MNALQKLVADRLRELGLGPVEAATSAGIERTFLRDLVEGKKKTVRGDKADDLARGLRIPVARIHEAMGRGNNSGRPRSSRVVRVGAYVQAGHFAERWEIPENYQYEVAVPDDEPLRSYQLYAAETRGPSMNRRWPEGTVVVFTNAADTHESPVPGKRYVVERRRGDEAEHTVKLLHRDENGKLWLVPESHDPLFQQPISIEDGLSEDSDQVSIIGRVWYSVTREG